MPASSKVACGSLVPLSAGHAYASRADARSSFGDNGGGGDGAPQRLISAWSSLRSTISSRPTSCPAVSFEPEPRTTKLYDRTGDEISLDEVERIVI